MDDYNRTCPHCGGMASLIKPFHGSTQAQLWCDNPACMAIVTVTGYDKAKHAQEMIARACDRATKKHRRRSLFWSFLAGVGSVLWGAGLAGALILAAMGIARLIDSLR